MGFKGPEYTSRRAGLSTEVDRLCLFTTIGICNTSDIIRIHIFDFLSGRWELKAQSSRRAGFSTEGERFHFLQQTFATHHDIITIHILTFSPEGGN